MSLKGQACCTSTARVARIRFQPDAACARQQSQHISPASWKVTRTSCCNKRLIRGLLRRAACSRVPAGKAGVNVETGARDIAASSDSDSRKKKRLSLRLGQEVLLRCTLISAGGEVRP